jgi:hypothetical protein
VLLHERHIQLFLSAWKAAHDADLILPVTSDPSYESLQTLGRHVLGAARNYVMWICEMLKLPDPGISLPPDLANIRNEADAYVEHLLEGWREALVDVSDDQLETPEYPSRWKTRYSIDAMLEHAVMHPIRHSFQLEELMRARS